MTNILQLISDRAKNTQVKIIRTRLCQGGAAPVLFRIKPATIVSDIATHCRGEREVLNKKILKIAKKKTLIPKRGARRDGSEKWRAERNNACAKK